MTGLFCFRGSVPPERRSNSAFCLDSKITAVIFRLDYAYNKTVARTGSLNLGIQHP